MFPIQRDLQRLALDCGNSTSSGEESPNGIHNKRRKFLGKFSEKILQEKLAKGIWVFGRPLTEVPEVKQCGVYAQNTVVRGVQIINVKGSHKFYLHQNILTREQQAIMLETPTIRFRNNQQVYAANPYHADIGDLKLYFNGTIIQRCQIKDLYCYPSNSRLELVAVIDLYDKPEAIQHVEYSTIFDYPQRIRYFKDIETETKEARLHLGEQVPEIFRDAEVEEFFAELVQGHAEHKLYNVVILDFKNNVYYVDLIGDNEQSAVTLMLQKFGSTKFRHFMDCQSPDSMNSSDSLEPFYPVRRMLPPKRATIAMDNSRNRRLFNRGGALAYFKSLLSSIDQNDLSTSYTSKRFLKVLVIDWLDPDHITVQPAAQEYYAQFEEFIKAIQNLNCVKQADMYHYKKDVAFRPGEHILFKNVSCDRQLGKWLRGVVVSVSCYNNNSLVVAHTTTDSLQNHKVVSGLIEKKILDPDDLIYVVRSVDFGYHCRSSQFNMRHLESIKEVRTIGTWGLRCRLFGVNLLPGDNKNEWSVPKHSKLCVDVMNSWIRERILNSSRVSHYHALFRSDLENRQVWDSYDHLYDTTLFHRSEPDWINSLRRRARFDCLNWHLVDCGIASDACRNNPEESSNIQLDQCIIDKLVSHDML